MATPPRAAPPAIFAHLHSSPLVVRRRNGSEWRSLSSSGFRQTPGAAANVPSSGPTPPSLTPLGLEGINSSGLEPVDIIDVKQERKLLVQCLREAKKRIVWHTEVADLHTFRKVLSFGCRVLHFSGHGVPGKVIFENNKCEAQFISQQELKDLLLAGGMEKCRPPTMDPSKPLGGLERQSSAGVSSGGSDEEEFAASEIERGWLSLHPPPRVPVRLVFVSACHSESVAEAFVSAGVPHVVVVSKDDKVLDKKAMEFSKAFYTALFAGHSVQRAFEIGQVQADISTTCATGNSKFKLLGHGNHHETLFRDVPLGSFVENSLPPPLNECDAVAEVFVGRSLEIHQVYKSLVEGARLVTVTGDRGIGKTEVALQCAQYATERRVFKHIFFLRLELSEPSSEPTTPLIQRLAKSLGVPTAVSNEEELANAVRQLCVDGPFLLILDGCQRLTRRDTSFRIILHHLLRRVSTLAILITSDSKIGAMDGVSEKIVAVEHLPPADAALLFTLRAPRRLKAHEMGGSTDLAAFAENPIIKSLMGHPRCICAVAQFLETKDMELDKHEFLNYIIPSVNAGLAVENCDDHTQCFPVLPQDCHIDTHPVHSHHHHHPHSHPHPHHEHTMLPHQQRWASMPSMPVFREASPSEKTLASLAEEVELQLQFEDMPNNVRGSSMSTDTGHLSAPRPTLEPSRSENDLHMRRPPISKPLTEAELCVLNLSDSLKALVRMDLEGRLTWARAVVTASATWNVSTAI
ncbi:hypothetical protein Poli38472_010644 [Pythium oligandrum]|uniref:CHAT domain-containing protein n=1 Tax=Pythium oligandrum TaxID=41045 RepID=A0A8K1C3G6_PYTOL|nr:hypothetical protein Poli38472_010644 [Pythium oligandrum]|eukprot:TMW55762.1 hypothetical protein Poli38472_010644 [Pythium oligandrum]